MEARTKKGPNKLLRLQAAIRRRMGGVAVEESQDSKANRPTVQPFVAGRDNLLDYARRNAARANLDMGGTTDTFLNRTVRRLSQSYDHYVNGVYQQYPDRPKPSGYGFTKEKPTILFQWNTTEVSQQTAEDLLYLMDAKPAAEPEELDLGEGVTRVSQEYSSSTGLRFIDVKVMMANREFDDPELHTLYVYFPISEEV